MHPDLFFAGGYAVFLAPVVDKTLLSPLSGPSALGKVS